MNRHYSLEVLDCTAPSTGQLLRSLRKNMYTLLRRLLTREQFRPQSLMETSRLPFHIPKVYAGCAKIDGLLIVTAEHVLLEYRLSDRWLGALTSRVITRTLEYRLLEKAELHWGFFRPKIILRARTLEAFAKLPQAGTIELKLNVAWRDRTRLRPTVSDINLNISFMDADRYRLRVDGL